MGISFERTSDRDLIAQIMTHPQVYAGVADDYFPAPENFYPAENAAVYYLLARDGAELLGLVITHAVNAILWEVHHALLPEAWGAPAHAVARAFEEWLWTNTAAETAIGFTPADHALALRYARRHGMAEVGRIPRAIQRGGELRELVVFAKSRPAQTNLVSQE